MNYVVGYHKVKDFSTWKPFFDKDEQVRQAAGMKLVYLFRSVQDPNSIHLLFEVEDLGKVKRMMESEELKKKMEESGVIGEPVFHVLEKV